MRQFSQFGHIVKADAAKQLVWGVLASEEVDASNEIMDYAKSKPYFEAWSSELAKATGGKNLGNVRYMHKSESAGRLVEITFDDDAKVITGCAKINQEFWPKVDEGDLTGFSIGGRYISKTKEGDLTRYVAAPAEVSIVDNPCLKAAYFTCIKADGETVQIDLPVYEPAADDVRARADELMKDDADLSDDDALIKADADLRAAYALSLTKGDDAVDADPVAPEVNAEDIGVVQKWCYGAKQFDRKADALAAAAAASNPLLEAIEGAVAKTAAPTLADLACPDLAVAKAAFDVVSGAGDESVLLKSFGQVRVLAGIIQDLKWLTTDKAQECEWSNGDAAVPQELFDNLKDLAATLTSMVQEATAEMIAHMKAVAPTTFVDGYDTMTDDDEVMKALSAADARADALIKAAPVVAPAPVADPTLVEELAKADAARQLLQKQMDEALPAIKALAEEVVALRAKVTKVEAQPMPMPGVVVAKTVEKAAPINLDTLVKEYGQDAVAIGLATEAMRRPVPIG